ncbi:hypothetical protein LS68_003620 [Helicobacter sp. MIT 05-5293]|uniref:hypothetical protein n=1 Tax=Helicobacter sp. MIT 05-5293 TaxID=1548149 RepID=UPI0010FD93DE|nr:hypothetical protein [Helicobacter sp. MIT 05-5293]TLD82096.1 hypothetical protein LS68_003620 [Helicobacter sp. MIT 05-5293]
MPDDFAFRAVIDEGWEASQEDLLGSQSLEGSEEENAALIKEFIETSWLGDWEHHYDIKSKQWIDYKDYWTNRILETLESKRIFMTRAEFFFIKNEIGRVFINPGLQIFYFYNDLQDFYKNNIDEFIIYYKKIYKKGQR